MQGLRTFGSGPELYPKPLQDYDDMPEKAEARRSVLLLRPEWEAVRAFRIKSLNLRNMEIVYRKLSDIRPNPKNPRKRTDAAVQALAESIKANPQFFDARPILLSDRTGDLVIIGGRAQE